MEQDLKQTIGPAQNFRLSRFCIVTVMSSSTQLWFSAFSFKGGFVFHSASEKISVSQNRCVEKFPASVYSASPPGYCGSLLYKSLGWQTMLWLLPSMISYQRKGGEDFKSSHQQIQTPSTNGIP